MHYLIWYRVFFVFQAEDGIRDLVRSRGLGDVYKRQAQTNPEEYRSLVVRVAGYSAYFTELDQDLQNEILSLIHI